MKGPLTGFQRLLAGDYSDDHAQAIVLNELSVEVNGEFVPLYKAVQ